MARGPARRAMPRPGPDRRWAPGSGPRGRRTWRAVYPTVRKRPDESPEALLVAGGADPRRRMLAVRPRTRRDPVVVGDLGAVAPPPPAPPRGRSPAPHPPPGV